MYVIIKSDEANHIENKLHKMAACISEVVDMIHGAKRISHMPEEYRHSGFDTQSEHHHPMEDRTRMGYDPYYSPHDTYTDDYRRGGDFEDRHGRGRY